MSRAAGAPRRDFPLWLAAAGLGCGAVVSLGLAGGAYGLIFATVLRGLGVTLFVSAVAFALSCALGLAVAACGLSRVYLLRQAARLYVEVVRGIPALVLLFYVAFVAAPWLVELYDALTAPLRALGLADRAELRDFSLLWRAVIALTVSYAAFVSEVFRAGLQAVDRGQVEAALVLGLRRLQVFRLVTGPQALRTVLPPLGNDFIALVKDSALVSVLGVGDMTQMGKLYSSGSFRFFETYNVVACLYLMLTLALSLGLRALERRLRRGAA